MRDDPEGPDQRDAADTVRADARGDAQRVLDATDRDDARSAERRFKRRIDCSSRPESPAWSDGRFR